LKFSPCVLCVDQDWPSTGASLFTDFEFAHRLVFSTLRKRDPTVVRISLQTKSMTELVSQIVAVFLSLETSEMKDQLLLFALGWQIFLQMLAMGFLFCPRNHLESICILCLVSV
jgi:hypothetical protein